MSDGNHLPLSDLSDLSAHLLAASRQSEIPLTFFKMIKQYNIIQCI